MELIVSGVRYLLANKACHPHFFITNAVQQNLVVCSASVRARHGTQSGFQSQLELAYIHRLTHKAGIRQHLHIRHGIYLLSKLHSILECVYVVFFFLLYVVLVARVGISFLINHFLLLVLFESYIFGFAAADDDDASAARDAVNSFGFDFLNKWFTSFQRIDFINECPSVFASTGEENVIIYSLLELAFWSPAQLCTIRFFFLEKKAYLIDWKRAKNNNYFYVWR